MFILASSVCESLQCLISTLMQGGEGGHLLRLTSVVLWRGRDIANKYCWHVCGVPAVYGAHWVCPSSRQHVLPGSTLLSLQGLGSLSKVGPAFHAPPRSKPLRCSGTPQGHSLFWVCIFVPFPGLSSSGDQVFGKWTVPGGPCILITSPVPASFPDVLCVSSGELISGCNPPGRCQPSRIPGKRG